MNILFIHQNFPGQFKHLAVELARSGHNVIALTLRVKKMQMWKGVRLIPYSIQRKTGQKLHPWLVDLDTKVTRGEACYRAAVEMREKGYTPTIIIAHPGWGESLFLKDVWPDVPIGLYCELYHSAEYPHAGFDPEFDRNTTNTDPLRIRLKNLNNHLHFPYADAGISPTQFQADTFPADFRDKIDVIHDGIDTTAIGPDPEARFELPNGTVITRNDEVITFVNRNLEPYRGYHIFMRALPLLLKERPNAKIVITGGDEVSYGARPPNGQTWKQIFIDEVRGDISTKDWQRVHFLGRIPYETFIPMLQVSTVHIYLTYPFVLSWSLFETMAVEGAIVASDTAPVVEALEHDVNGRLVDFFDVEAIVRETCDLLDDPEARARLGKKARNHIVENYDLRNICLPRQLEWVNKLAQS